MKRLDLSTLQWTFLPNQGEKPKPSKESVLVYNKDHFLLTAGVLENEKDCLHHLYRYSLTTLSWSVISDKSSHFKCRYLAKGFVYEDTMFVLFGWLTLSNQKATDVVKFDLKSEKKAWEEVEIMKELSADEYSMTQTEDFVFLFGGSNHALDSISNKLDKIELKHLKIVPMTENMRFPCKRSMHSMVVINSKFYVFGGIDIEEVFKDIWSFDFRYYKWEQVPAKGNFPHGRFSHAAAAEGDAFVVWGGQDLHGLLNDLFIFNAITETWTELISVNSEKPRPAKGACLVLKNYKIYLYGGKTDSNVSNELWEFDIGQSQFKMISNHCPLSLTFPYCWIENDLFFVSLGSKVNEEPSPEIIYFNFSSNSWNVYHTHRLTSDDSAQSVQFFINGQLISIGGQSWMQDAVQSISLFGPGNQQKTLTSELDFSIYGSASVYYNKSLFVFGGGRVSGGSLLPATGHNLLLELKLEEICKDRLCRVLCSSGTKSTEKTCEVCVAGTFAEGLGSSVCKPCPVGSYNQNIGSSSSQQCLPCPEGKFSNISGAKSCEDCPEDKYCPIGSSGFYARLTQEAGETIQPPLYEDPDLRKLVMIYQIVASLPLFLLFLVFLAFKKLRMNLFKLDLYDHNHENHESEYIIKKKTNIGACFSFLFVIGALLITCSSVLNFFRANVHESKGLVTLAVIESEVKVLNADEISLKITLKSYGGRCHIDSKCPDSMKLIENFISHLKRTVFCKTLENKSCEILIIYHGVAVQTGCKVSLSFTESSSFASGIEVNLTSSSSIPDQISSVVSEVSSENDSIFIGSLPSEFFFLATPSLFKSESSLWEGEVTGYHISERSAPKLGSQFKTHDIPAVSYLNLNIFIEKSSAGLLTKRLLKQNYMFFIGSLLGTVSGFFSVTGFVMRIFERSCYRYLNRKELKSDDHEDNSTPDNHKNYKVAHKPESHILHTNTEQDS